MIDLTTPIEKLARVGPKSLSRLKKLGIKTVKDLLWHFPARYEDFSAILPIAQVEAGAVVNIKGRVVNINTASLWRRGRTVTDATVEDESGIIHAAWFNQPYIEKSLPEGTMVSLAGKAVIDKKGLYLSNPAYEKNYGRELTHTGRLVPVYPETEGITSKYLRFLIKPLLSSAHFLPDPLPQEILKKYGFPPLGEALCSVHFPKTLERAEAAGKRFAFEELLLFQLRLLRDRRWLKTLRAPRIDFDKELIAGFVKNLPFELTNDQRLATYEILQDLERPYPMNRLLNGDVGSGKTVVALIAAFETAAARYQVVFMAPTEILAKQHYQTIKLLLSDKRQAASGKPIRIGLLTGSEARQFPVDETAGEKVSKKLMQKKIADGEIDIIIGTHAVIQKGVGFKKLGFVIIDEQHRFGVEQRMALAKGGTGAVKSGRAPVPHLLSMTATPIPRTLALTMYGDLDISLLKEKPKGRQPIATRVIPHEKRGAAYRFIEDEIEKGRQVFVICPRIELSEAANEKQRSTTGILSQAKLIWAEVKAVTAEYEKLSKEIFPARRVAMLHGRMKPKEKDEVMRKFRNKHLDLLVSTSVIEVGVDISNATVMMIESAERFGLAQLHQFRGRIGRGGQQSFCLLFTSSSDVPANRRLRALERTDNGFELAEMDLKLRGPGEFAGVKQSGIPDFAMASLADIELIKKARLEAKLLLKSDPSLKFYPALLARLSEMQRLVHFE
jgi:ATP-dependent DNA helicase RecG